MCCNGHAILGVAFFVEKTQERRHMSERQSLEKLAAARAAHAGVQLDAAADKERERTGVRQENARRIQTETAELTAQAETALAQVIQPWWQQLHGSALGRDLELILRAGGGSLLASDPIPFFWQRNEEDEGRTYQAQLAVYSREGQLQSSVRREIPGARGMVAGYLNNSLTLTLDLVNPQGKEAEIHPRVWIELAQQIQDGRVEENLRSFLTR